MKKLVMGAILMTAAASAMAGVAVSVGQPGFYGQIILGDAYPAPQLVYPQPVIIQPPAVAVVQPPMYLHVPPGHMKKWSRYCGHYGACGRQVYFVQDAWYQNVYVPTYKAHPPHGGPGHAHAHHKHPGPGKHGDRGRGHGHGKD